MLQTLFNNPTGKNNSRTNPCWRCTGWQKRIDAFTTEEMGVKEEKSSFFYTKKCNYRKLREGNCC